MMGKMRDMTKWILYILIFAFVGLMVVEWGADYSGISAAQNLLSVKLTGRKSPWNNSTRHSAMPALTKSSAAAERT